MYGNSNQYWKKTVNTTNVEVVIDDPSQIQDTYITNRQVFQDVSVFDATANDFVYQPSSNNLNDAVRGQSDIFIMLGLSGDSGSGGLQGITINRRGPGDIVVIPNPFIPELNAPIREDCIDDFNDFLKIFEELKEYLSPWSELDWLPYKKARRLLGASKWWLPQELPSDYDNFYAFLACILANSGYPGKDFFESDYKYIRRILGTPIDQKELILDIPFFLRSITPDNQEELLPRFPEQLPLDINRAPFWAARHKEVLERFDRDAKRALEALRRARENGSDWLKNIPEPCRARAKEFLKQLARDLQEVLKLTEILLRLKKAFDKLRNSDCWGILRLEEEFNKRNIGRFESLEQFMEWIKQLVPLMQEKPLSPPPIDLNPYKALLSDDEKQLFQNNLFGDFSLSERVDIAYTAYQSWLNEPEETRSDYPPIKALIRTLDDKEGSPIMNDEDAYVLLTMYILITQFTEPNTGYPNDNIALTDDFIQDAIINMISFVSQPTESFIPARFTA